MTAVQRFGVPVAFVALCALMAWLTWPEGEGAPEDVDVTPEAEPIAPRVSLDSLLAVEASATHAPGVSTAGRESATPEAAVERGASSSTTPLPAPSSTPRLLTVTPSVTGAPDYAAIAACGPSCWGTRMTRAEVEALALAVSGDTAWSAWAGWCFSAPGHESGGYPQAVGGPNRDGSFDVGIVQLNEVHDTWADMARVLADPAYALRMAYRLHGQQGAGAWRGC